MCTHPNLTLLHIDEELHFSKRQCFLQAGGRLMPELSPQEQAINMQLNGLSLEETNIQLRMARYEKRMDESPSRAQINDLTKLLLSLERQLEKVQQRRLSLDRRREMLLKSRLSGMC
jgi:hypothetical protein